MRSLVLWESARLRRAELERIGPFGRFWDEVKATIRNPAPVELALSPARAAAGAGSATFTVREPETPEEELQRRVGELEEALGSVSEQLASESRDVRAHIERVATYSEKRDNELREKQKTDLGGAIHNQNIRAVIFLLGVIFDLVAGSGRIGDLLSPLVARTLAPRAEPSRRRSSSGRTKDRGRARSDGTP